VGCQKRRMSSTTTSAPIRDMVLSLGLLTGALRFLQVIPKGQARALNIEGVTEGVNSRDRLVRCVCVFITAGPSAKLLAWGGGILEDMCYERRRAEACVD